MRFPRKLEMEEEELPLDPEIGCPLIEDTIRLDVLNV